MFTHFFRTRCERLRHASADRGAMKPAVDRRTSLANPRLTLLGGALRAAVPDAAVLGAALLNAAVLGAAALGAGSTLGCGSSQPGAQGDAKHEVTSLTVRVNETLAALLAEEDLDGDKRITVEDQKERAGTRGDGRFVLARPLTDSQGTLTVEGTWPLAILVEELYAAQQRGESILEISRATLSEAPISRISRRIREEFWQGLTRQLDAEGLAAALEDSKVPVPEGTPRYLYVAKSDPQAVAYYTALLAENPQLEAELVVLNGPPDPNMIGELTRDFRHGLLALKLDDAGKPLPFVVPGGRYNEIYGWDTYFIVQGLLLDGHFEQARMMVEHLAYSIEHYGQILNANRTYYANRSNPPFFTSMVRKVAAAWPVEAAGETEEGAETQEASAEAPPARGGEAAKEPEARTRWLRAMTQAALKEYSQVWMTKPRTLVRGLQRYLGSGQRVSVPPETEAGHYDAVFERFAKKYKLSSEDFLAAYTSGALRAPDVDAFLVHDRCMRESGHDTTYRWQVDGEDRCADFVTVDLNSLLHKTEVDLAHLLDAVGGALKVGGKRFAASDLRSAAAKRRTLMRKLLWDAESNTFADYDTKTKQRHPWASPTMLYPLWAIDADDPSSWIVSEEEGHALIDQAMRQLRTPGGLAGSAPNEGALGARQWDHPYGWAPHQIIAWEGLKHYGRNKLAQELARDWLAMISDNASRYHGVVPEKFDVVARSHQVFAEYGNVGTDFAYITQEGFGWMNTSIQLALSLLAPAND